VPELVSGICIECIKAVVFRSDNEYVTKSPTRNLQLVDMQRFCVHVPINRNNE
jgi:hypothetical protein